MQARPARRPVFALLFVLALVLGVPAIAGAACGDSEHPSGNDRCVEAGGSNAQGNAQSDPDDNGNPPERSNGGYDQRPDTAEGAELQGQSTASNPRDRDNNNGCGNDQDFEDDNEGLCGGTADTTNNTVLKKKTKKSLVLTTKKESNPRDERVTEVRDSAVPPRLPLPAADRATLPATGGPPSLALAGLGLIGVGTAALRHARRRTSG